MWLPTKPVAPVIRASACFPAPCVRASDVLDLLLIEPVGLVVFCAAGLDNVVYGPVVLQCPRALAAFVALCHAALVQLVYEHQLEPPVAVLGHHTQDRQPQTVDDPVAVEEMEDPKGQQPAPHALEDLVDVG